MPGVGLRSPAPAFFAPIPRLAVAIVFDECSELSLRHRDASDGETLYGNLMCPFFIVEHERLIRLGSEPEIAARDIYIPLQRPGGTGSGLGVLRANILLRCWIAER